LLRESRTPRIRQKIDIGKGSAALEVRGVALPHTQMLQKEERRVGLAAG